MKHRFSFLSNPLIQIHTAVFLWGFTAILGKLISVDALHLVFFRMMLAAMGYAFIPLTYKGLRGLSTRRLLLMILTGCIIAVHWLCFYQSIKVFDSASIALVCLGTGPMFVLWIDFLVNKTPIGMQNLLISIISLIGMIFLSMGYSQGQSIHSESQYLLSIAYGLGASFLAAVFTLINKGLSNEVEPITLSFVELFSGAILLSIVLVFVEGDIPLLTSLSQKDLFYLLTLSVVCTNIPFLLSIYSLEKLKAFTVTLTVNLEPIYGLIFASMFFQEYKQFNFSFFIGTFLILISVFLPIVNRIKGK